MKGQMEFIVILGIMFVVVVVAYYAIQGGGLIPSPVPKGVYDEQRQVADSVRGVIRDAADNTLRTMMAHGGYLDTRMPGVTRTYEDVDHVEFLFMGVPYWQRCDNVMYPDIRNVKSWMESSIKKIVLEGMDDIEQRYGNRADFDKGRVDVDVEIKGEGPLEPDMVDVTVTMPTTVRNYTMSGDLYPYRVGIDSKFGEIYAFARDFAEASADNRYFDVFTIAAIYLSQEMGDGHPKLPTSGAMTQCGEVVYRSPQQINAYLYEILEYVMVSTEWWKPMENLCPGGSCLPQTKDFAIQDLNGETYPGLDIRTLMADEWDFGLFDFVFATNFKMPSHGGFSIPVCTAVYNHAYNFSYPFIVRVKDPYTGYSFNFASEVGISEGGDQVMEPSSGGCGSPGAGLLECTETELQCRGRVRVVNELGVPMEGAWVVFGGCPVGDGETDGNGYVEGPIRCGTGTQELFVYQTGDYEFLKREVSASELEPGKNYQARLNPVNKVRVHFREVSITYGGFYYDYEEEKQFQTCDACAVICDIDTVTVHQCDIGPVDREHALVEFDNGYMNLPVSNVDASKITPGCDEDWDCVFCNENIEDIESQTPDMQSVIAEACRNCTQDCYSGPPLTSTLVDYLPSGYGYDVDATMSMANYMPRGSFSYSGFDLGSEDRDVYVYIPRRSSDSGLVMTESEKACMAAAMQECEIGPVSTEEYLDNTIVLPGCDCSYLNATAAYCGAPRPDLFPYCTTPCGGPLEEPCEICCNKQAALDHLKGLEQSCQVRVICTEE
jgi:hypothetical protein